MQSVAPLDLAFEPEAAISGPVVLQHERLLLLSFNAVDTTVLPHPDLGRAVIEFIDPLLTRFGYPNDEALRGHPLYAAGLDTHGYGGFEVLESSWKIEIEEQNRIAFPAWPGWDVRHFAFVFHDSMFECLAGDYVVRFVGGDDTADFHQALNSM
jgi:hypothetical protein